ncbi:Lipase maturation factor 1 [Fukomys damarensis]|uniref:Lipase maturation factor n=1 Tax=Fukomys damarensis TaxID=885580 RepID=A0A091DWW0_FUKDA|nr:Lipase maturation factor 1 [Fukomys damarensis]
MWAGPGSSVGVASLHRPPSRLRLELSAMAASEGTLRKRKVADVDPGPGSPPLPEPCAAACPTRLRVGTFWLTRIVLLKALALVYFVAFLVAFHQNKQLIGEWGLLPCKAYLKSIQQYFHGRIGWDAWSYAPTILWLLDWSDMNFNLDLLAVLGLGISSFILITGCANMILMAMLWVLYLSLVSVGQVWYSFGWESQLLETGFLGIFLCPLWTLSRLPKYTPTSQVVLWGFRWLIFRIMLGAGLIKIRGDQCWWDLTCMDYHYESFDVLWRIDYTHTQPVPNPLAYFLHQSPWWFHRFETLSNHVLELLVPFLVFLGRRLCLLHGVLQIFFQGGGLLKLSPNRTSTPVPGSSQEVDLKLAGQWWRIYGLHAALDCVIIENSKRFAIIVLEEQPWVVLILSGNLSFLNWLTIVPSLSCFDDATLGFLFPSGPGGLKDQVLRIHKEEAGGAQPKPRYGCLVRRVANLSLGILLAWLSVPVVINLLSSKQVMNTSFSPLRIVNTYGAFGSITKERTEVILQGTASTNASAPDAVWEDYEFKCKPGDPWRRPCLISPYHYRLDWLMWFAAFQTYEQNEWILHLAGKLLANDAEALSLLALNPFEGRAPPRWVRGEHWRYRFSRPGGKHASEGKWWARKRIGPYFPPLCLEDLKDYFQAWGWPLAEPM